MIYLASPYTDPDTTVMHQRFLLACTAVGLLTGRGEIVYSPIVHFHPVAQLMDLPRDFEFWRKQNFAMIEICVSVTVLRLPGWETSRGVNAETAYAKLLGRPVTYMDSVI